MFTALNSLPPVTRHSVPRGKVLIVDDDSGPRESLRILLKYDFQVELAGSVAEGVRQLRAQAFDVIVLDNRMPDRSGMEGIKDLRALDQDVSIIMLTGFGTMETAIEAIHHQVTDFMTKPPDTDEMIAAVGRNAALTRAKRARTNVSLELGELNKTLAEELEVARPLALIGQRTDEIIHDFGNPLTILTCCIDMLQKSIAEMRPEAGSQWLEAMGYVEMLKNSVQHCCGLASDWRKSRDDSREAPADQSARAFLRATVQSITPRATLMGVSLTLEDADLPGEALVSVDALQMRRVLGNLIVNALQAAEPAGRTVRVQGRMADEEFIVAVTDNGGGIDADRLARVFEPYYTTKQNGTGLGLAISKRIVQEHGGTLTAESEVGRGSTFQVRLPLAETPITA